MTDSRFTRILLAAWLLIFSPSLALASEGVRPPETPENVAAGRAVYFNRCSFCHGLNGDGNGPAAPYLDPRPRDFTLGVYKFRTTESGELPLDEDLFRTVSRGLSGTAMQPFDDALVKNGLTAAERWQVVYYVKTFAPEFVNADYDPKGATVLLPQLKAPYGEETIRRGEEIFLKAKCFECHGKGGRGDGLKTARKDDWGYPVRIRNLTQPWRLKAGGEVEEIYMRLSTGISGTPMPSYRRNFTDEERWALACYIKSLQEIPAEGAVVRARKTDGALPLDPDAEAWRTAVRTDVMLTGQAVEVPRWQNPSVELVSLRALYNDGEIAFLLEWDDPFPDKVHDPAKETDKDAIGPGGWISPYDGLPPGFDNFRDAVALQFSLDAGKTARRPRFLRGDAENPVALWTWKADRVADGAGGVETAVARGYAMERLTELQRVESASRWEGGRYRVVIKRTLKAEGKEDVSFEEGRFIPLALNVWDASNGEHGLVMGLSAWHYLLLEAPTSSKAYLLALIGAMLTGLGEVWLVRRLKLKDGK